MFLYLSCAPSERDILRYCTLLSASGAKLSISGPWHSCRKLRFSICFSGSSEPIRVTSSLRTRKSAPASWVRSTSLPVIHSIFSDFICASAERSETLESARIPSLPYSSFTTESSFAKVGNALLSTLGTLKSIRFLHSSRPVRSVMGGAPLLLLTDNTCKLSKCRRSASETTGSYVPSTLTAQAASCSLLLTFPPMSTPSGASLTMRSPTPVPEFIETR